MNYLDVKEDTIKYVIICWLIQIPILLKIIWNTEIIGNQILWFVLFIFVLFNYLIYILYKKNKYFIYIYYVYSVLFVGLIIIKSILTYIFFETNEINLYLLDFIEIVEAIIFLIFFPATLFAAYSFIKIKRMYIGIFILLAITIIIVENYIFANYLGFSHYNNYFGN